MEQMSLPFLNKMTIRDGCSTCKYINNCDDVMSRKCFDKEYSYSKIRGAGELFYNKWEKR